MLDVYTFIRSLDMKQREKLAKEIKTTAGYLHFLASKEDCLSVRKAEAILKSRFNKSLPNYQRYTKEAFAAFHQEKLATKSA